jgi:hypothetical protein
LGIIDAIAKLAATTRPVVIKPIQKWNPWLLKIWQKKAHQVNLPGL